LSFSLPLDGSVRIERFSPFWVHWRGKEGKSGGREIRRNGHFNGWNRRNYSRLWKLRRRRIRKDELFEAVWETALSEFLKAIDRQNCHIQKVALQPSDTRQILCFLHLFLDNCFIYQNLEW
jgi:hypothetical protein